MTARTVLGPHGYSRPPYGSFAGKPFNSGTTKGQGPFSVLGPHGYSRQPYASFAGRAPQVSTKTVAGWFPGWNRKRWWEELEEEYRQRYDREDAQKATKAKDAVVARKKAKKVADEAIESGLLDFSQADYVAGLLVSAEYAKRREEAINRAQEILRYLEMLQDDEDVLLLL